MLLRYRISCDQCAYANSKCFYCGVPITNLQHHNKHEYNIDSLLNIQFAIVVTLHHLPSTTQKQYKYNVGKM